MQGHISDTGISVVYEPEEDPPIVDIVIIHGLQGHPFKTWAYTKGPKTTVCSVSHQSEPPKSGRNGIARSLRRATAWSERAPSESTADTLVDVSGPSGYCSDDTPPSVFWPADLLAKECPRSRILMYGYDTQVTKYMRKATNKNSIFAHGKDLLFSLCRVIEPGRPLIFVAHSLGGIVVKEMLAKSAISAEDDLRKIVEATAAVVFLGTPHRGSPDLAAFGEWARSIASALRMETTRTILQALSLKTADLERAQETFSGLWQRYDFRVKTFQEGLGLTGVHLGVLGNKVVPDYSSIIGDQRENAETLQANHMDMCRYAGVDDPNYIKVAGELRSIYLSLLQLNSSKSKRSGHKKRHGSIVSTTSSTKVPDKATSDRLDSVEKAFLRSLRFPTMRTRLQDVEKPADQTGHWLFQHKLYTDWFNCRNQEEYCGLLWLKGKPGAGKSVLMKEAFRRMAQEQTATSRHCTAAFFFNAKGDSLEKSPLGLFRSLLHQLLPFYHEDLQGFSRIWYRSNLSGEDDIGKAPWQESELRSTFQSIFSRKSAMKTYIFIDGLDECDWLSIRSQAYFWREITKSAYAAGVHLNVCLSSRHYPSVTVSDCPEIVVENHNNHDIATYVDQKFRLGIAAAEPRWEKLREKILNKSAGVFFWVILVVDKILKEWDDGKGLQHLLAQLDIVPDALEALFSQMFRSLDPAAKRLTVRLFQWAILATSPLRLHEWHHVLAFIRQPTPTSLYRWRKSDYFTENDDQLERQIRSISKGLIEVRTRGAESYDKSFETLSACAAAGSLDFEHGETRVVQVIHQSVREFFLQGRGFSVLDPSLELDAFGNGHLSIISTCLDYLEIMELDALIEARALAAQSELARWTRKPSQHGRTHLVQCSSSRSSISISTGRKGTENERRPTSRREKRSRRDEEGSVIEMLRVSCDPAPGIDIRQWLEASHLLSDGVLNASPCTSTTHFSVSGRSQVLEDYPALLSYATFEMFSHARLAEKKGTDPSPIINRLQSKGVWDRWVTLREDLPQDVILLQYAASQGLSTWVKYICDKEAAIYQRLSDESHSGELLGSGTADKSRTKITDLINNAIPSKSSEEDYARASARLRSGSKSQGMARSRQRDDIGDTEYGRPLEDWDVYASQVPDYGAGVYRRSSVDSDGNSLWYEGSIMGSVASFGSAGSHTGNLTAGTWRNKPPKWAVATLSRPFTPGHGVSSSQQESHQVQGQNKPHRMSVFEMVKRWWSPA